MSASETGTWICQKCGTQNDRAWANCTQCASALAAAPEPDPLLLSAREVFRLSPHTFLWHSLAVVGAIAWFSLLWEFRKWSASWGGFPVLLASFLAGAPILIIFRVSNWYHHGAPAGLKWIILPVTGFVVSAAVGIYFTEPIELGGATTRSSGSPGIVDRDNPDYRYDYRLSRIGRGTTDLFFLDALAEGGSVDIDDEACLFLIIAAIVLIAIVGSAVIPHFWVLSTFLCLVIIGALVYRETSILPRQAAERVI